MSTLSEAGHAVGKATPVDGLRQESLRTCVGCRQRADRSGLLRVVAVEADGCWSVVPDLRRRLPGRGAWLHPATECLQLAHRRRAFARALRRSEQLDLTAVRELLTARSGTT